MTAISRVREAFRQVEVHLAGGPSLPHVRRIPDGLWRALLDFQEQLAAIEKADAAPDLLLACRVALRMQTGHLLCAPYETDRECLNRYTRELTAALTTAIAKGEVRERAGAVVGDGE